MERIDLRQSINAISDVINNRPRPLREFDQIYMKAADMLLQTEHISRYVSNRNAVFIGDGDAIGLCLVHLHHQGHLSSGPEKVTILDFDERVIFSVARFAEQYGISNRVSAELYNVVDPLPESHWHRYDAFYTNPPFGASNGGASVAAFVQRGSEAVTSKGFGCIVLADDPELSWSQETLRSTQDLALDLGFVIAELIPQFHRYHLDDAPDLTSCSMVIRRVCQHNKPSKSEALSRQQIENFYGRNGPLRVRYVRDLTDGGKRSSRDHRMEPIKWESHSERDT